MADDPMANLRAVWKTYYELPLIQLFVNFKDNAINELTIAVRGAVDDAAVAAVKGAADAAIAADATVIVRASVRDAAGAADAAIAAVRKGGAARKGEETKKAAANNTQLAITARNLLLAANGLINPNVDTIVDPVGAAKVDTIVDPVGAAKVDTIVDSVVLETTNAAGKQGTAHVVPVKTNDGANTEAADLAAADLAAADLAKRLQIETDLKKKGLKESLKDYANAAINTFGLGSKTTTSVDTLKTDAQTLYITAENDNFKVSTDQVDGAYVMKKTNKDGCWASTGQVQKGGAITKNRRSRISKTRNHKSKNRMTKKHINGKKRGTRVKSMR